MADGDGAMPPPPGPAGMPPPGAPPPSPQSTGSSPAAMPVANRGAQAAGLPKISIAIKIAEAARLSMPPGSDPWKDWGKAIELMAKHVPPGAVSQGVEKTELDRLQQQQKQSSMNTALMRSVGGGGGGQPGQPPAPPPQMPQG